MYSLVLMTAMTTAPDGPEFHGAFRNLFRGGCSGSASPGGCSADFAPRYSCYGGGCAGFAYTYGCSGSSSSAGCRGDGFGSRVRRLFDRGGCCGGSGSGYACFGSGSYSCFGGPAVGYTPVLNGGLSCFGGPALPAPPPVFDPLPAVPRPAPPATIPLAAPEPAPGPTAGLRPAGHTATPVAGGAGSGRATVVVRLPADAKLFVDARPLNLTGAERKFVSPELPAGGEFAYRFRAEYERDGETVSVTRRVAVRAGATVAVEFTDLTAKAAPAKGSDAPATAVSNPAPVVPPAPTTPAAPEAATDRATITVKLPAGASLYVDDKKSPSAEPVRRFSTPPLPGGREFAYLMRAEVVRDGRTE
ncbi:MAG: hypothetical protein C0501_29855, partial [Isosphaera sp.]|nr:hypothetical protein [Isosphaera sp.]